MSDKPPTQDEINKALYGSKSGKKAHVTVSDRSDRFEDNILFGSKIEMQRYRELITLQRGRAISQLRVHPLFKFIVNDIEVGSFEADFSYLDDKNAPVVEDVKGAKVSKTGKVYAHITKRGEFKIKCALMRACFGLKVEIVIR